MVCLGKGRVSVLGPTDMVPQDENKTKRTDTAIAYSHVILVKGAVQNVIKPVSQLTIHHNAIAYLKCSKEMAASTELLAYKPGKDNCSDGLMKILVSQAFHIFQQSCIRWVVSSLGW